MPFKCFPLSYLLTSLIAKDQKCVSHVGSNVGLLLYLLSISSSMTLTCLVSTGWWMCRLALCWTWLRSPHDGIQAKWRWVLGVPPEGCGVLLSHSWWPWLWPLGEGGVCLCQVSQSQGLLSPLELVSILWGEPLTLFILFLIKLFSQLWWRPNGAFRILSFLHLLVIFSWWGRPLLSFVVSVWPHGALLDFKGHNLLLSLSVLLFKLSLVGPGGVTAPWLLWFWELSLSLSGCFLTFGTAGPSYFPPGGEPHLEARIWGSVSASLLQWQGVQALSAGSTRNVCHAHQHAHLFFLSVCLSDLKPWIKTEASHSSPIGLTSPFVHQQLFVDGGNLTPVLVLYLLIWWILEYTVSELTHP